MERLGRHLGAGDPVVVVGEAGIGKTSLVRAAVEGAGRPRFEGGGLSSLAWLPYLPVMRALRRPVPTGDHGTVASFVQEQVGDGVLIVDDFQWADPDTGAVVPIVARRIGGIVTVVRTGDAGTAAALEVVGAAGFTVIEVGPLPHDVASEVVRSRRPGLETGVVERIVERAGGNPLFLEEQAASGAPSRTLKAALHMRLRACPPPARQAFALLSLLGRPAPPRLVGEAAGELAAAGLVTLDGDQVSIRHGLLAEITLASLDPDTRRRLHGRLARALPDAGESARHHAAAGERGDACSKAALAAERATLPGERASHLALAAACCEGEEADRLRLRACAALLQAGDHAGAEELLSGVAAEDREVQAEVALTRARARLAAGAVDEARAAVDGGLALVAGTRAPVEVRLRIEHARLPTAAGDSPVRRAAEAWAMARATGVDAARARMALGGAHLLSGSPAWLDQLDLALLEARAEGDIEAECLAADALVNGHTLAGDPGTAATICDEMVTRTRGLLLRGWEITFRSSRALVDLQRLGRYVEAITVCSELLADPLLGGNRHRTEATLALALADTGELRPATEVAAGALQAEHQRPDDMAFLLWVQSEIEMLSERVAQAVEGTGRCLAVLPPAAPLGSHARLTAAWATLGTPAFVAPEITASPFRALAGAATEAAALGCLATPGRAADAEQLFDEAARQWRGYQMRAELRCAWASAEAARLAGAVDRARDRLLAVEAASEALGMTPLLARVRRSLRAVGVRRAAGRGRPAGRLSAREQEVLSLVAEGLSSSEIAGRLAVGRWTVETQVRSGMAKLGARNRRQAALLAAQGGL